MCLLFPISRVSAGKPKINRGNWTPEEDQAILDGVKQYGNQWTLIAYVMGTGKTPTQVNVRYVTILNPNLKKGKFTPEEDQKILDWVAEHGEGEWGRCAVEKFGGTRSRKQVRERWTDYLNPNLKKGQWTSEEDQIISQKVKTIGRKWASIAKLLPGRSRADVSNRWNNCLNKKSQSDAPPEDQADPTTQLIDPQTATSSNEDSATNSSFTPVESTVGSPLFAHPPISLLQPPIDWSFLNSTQNSSVVQPAPVTDDSGNNSLPNLNLSAQNPPTVPTQQAASGNGDLNFLLDLPQSPTDDDYWEELWSS